MPLTDPYPRVRPVLCPSSAVSVGCTFLPPRRIVEMIPSSSSCLWDPSVSLPRLMPSVLPLRPSFHLTAPSFLLLLSSGSILSTPSFPFSFRLQKFVPFLAVFLPLTEVITADPRYATVRSRCRTSSPLFSSGCYRGFFLLPFFRPRFHSCQRTSYSWRAFMRLVSLPS